LPVQVRFVDYGSIVKLQAKSLLSLPEQVAVLPPAATPVQMLACSGIEDTPDMRTALENQLLGTNTSILLVRNDEAGDAADHYARFFVDGQELDFGCLVRENIDSTKDATACMSFMSVASTATIDGEGEEGGLIVGHTYPVIFSLVEAVDHAWLTAEHEAEELDQLMADLEALAQVLRLFS
jgi:hypothetical protein